jgi:bifunctional non-homologous end joining protein LigD
LWSRNEKRVDASYPEIVDALAALGCGRFVADGEIVAFDGAQTSFARLQGRIHLTGALDLLALGGAGLAGLPLRDRSGRCARRCFGALLTPLIQETSPFDDPVPEPDVHWVRPELVVQVGFTEWTTDGRLRHPRCTGLRQDKPAAEVIRKTR